jgi:hypothetical protein
LQSQKNRSTTVQLLLAILLVVMGLCAGAFSIWALFVYEPTPPAMVPVAAASTHTPTAKPTASPTRVEKPPATDTPTSPAQPPTDTPIPPTQPLTDTPIPTAQPPTDTPIPTAEPPTDTPILPTQPPTDTPTSQPPTDTPAPTATPTPRPPKPLTMNSPEYGMQAFLWWRPEVADRDLTLIKEAGFGWVKQGFGWRDIEGACKGCFDWSFTDRIVDQVERHELDLVVRLDHQPYWAGEYTNGPPANYSDFGDFVYALASRYKGRIRAYEIWNEPNLSREWGEKPPNPAEYTALLKIAYQRIKEADPNAMVISAGLTPTSRWDHVAVPDVEFLKGMYAAGAKPYFDVLGAHGAGYKAPPEIDPGVVAEHPVWGNPGDPSPVERKRVYCFRHVEDLRQVMVENGDADKQVAILEFGWTSDPRPDSPYHWHSVSDEEKADYFVRAYQYAKENWSPWIGLMSLIYVADSDWTEEDEQYWWSITYPDGRVHLAYEQLKAMPK